MAAVLAGCGGGDGEPMITLVDAAPGPDAAWARDLQLPAGEFVEANFLMSQGSMVTADYTVTGGEVTWDLHEHDPDDLSVIIVLETGTDAGGQLVLTAPHDGPFSMLWENQGAAAVRLVVELGFDGDVRLYSWN